MRYLSVCSGIEAATVAWHPLGWSPVGFAEIEPFPSAVLAHHYGSNMPGEPLTSNGVPNHGDFTALIDNPPDCDLLVGGTPCQAFSIAGQRRSLEDERGNLTLQFVRLAHAIGSLRWLVWENVPGVLSTEDNAFGCFLGGLVGADDALVPCEPPARGKSNAYWRWRAAGRWPVLGDDGVETGEFVERAEGHVIRWPDAGMVAGPRARLAWRVLDAQHFGLAQRRRRVFVVASPGGGGDPAAVLFEPRGLRGVFAAGRKEGQGAAGTSAYGISPDCFDRTGEGAGGSAGERSGLGVDLEIAYALRAKRPGGDAIAGTVSSKWSKGAGGPAGNECYNLVAHSLRGEGFDASEDGTGRGVPLVPVYAIQERAVCENPDAGPQGAGFREGIAYTLEARHHVQAVAFALRGRDGGHASSHANAGVPPAIAGAGSVRRLTPRECERLQGFPDDYTAIPWRGKPPENCPDGPRYKALGNSMAVPVMRWIGRRIQVADRFVRGLR